MSQCAALDALRTAYRDAVLEDRFDDAAEIYRDEIEPDFDYVKRTARRRRYLQTDHNGVSSIEIIAAADNYCATGSDWMAWHETRSQSGPFGYVGLSFDSVLRERIDARLGDLAREHLYAYRGPAIITEVA